eukprot:328325-Chlamydomonas_euryale.AAC.3
MLYRCGATHSSHKWQVIRTTATSARQLKGFRKRQPVWLARIPRPFYTHSVDHSVASRLHLERGQGWQRSSCLRQCW